jgi:hypothetical protein
MPWNFAPVSPSPNARPPLPDEQRNLKLLRDAAEKLGYKLIKKRK